MTALFSRDNDPILSLADWRTMGKPAADAHWSPGRSAFELAGDWLWRGAADRDVELLRAGFGFDTVVLDRGIAEKKTQFDANPRGPRNHDLLVTGTADGAALVLAVEGKADEPFDLTLEEWLASREKNPRSGARARLDSLTLRLFGATLGEEPALGALRYQLLSGLAGALADASKVSAERVVLLIHEFDTPRTTQARHRQNAADLYAFVTRLMPGERLTQVLADSWCAGPVTLSGDGAWAPKASQVHVAKLLTTRRSYDARLLLEDWRDRPLTTLSGRPKTVLRFDGDQATERGPAGQPVPVECVQTAIDRLVTEGELEISVDSVGYRSAFVGAVLREIPGAQVAGNRVLLRAG